MEQSHAKRLLEVANKGKHEYQIEIEKLRSAQFQAERTLDARERAHHQRVKGLEEQVKMLAFYS